MPSIRHGSSQNYLAIFIFLRISIFQIFYKRFLLIFIQNAKYLFSNILALISADFFVFFYQKFFIKNIFVKSAISCCLFDSIFAFSCEKLFTFFKDKASLFIFYLLFCIAIVLLIIAQTRTTEIK